MAWLIEKLMEILIYTADDSKGLNENLLKVTSELKRLHQK
jgi:hypothetical protein